jgi:hypothetical protein
MQTLDRAIQVAPGFAKYLPEQTRDGAMSRIQHFAQPNAKHLPA